MRNLPLAGRAATAGLVAVLALATPRRRPHPGGRLRRQPGPPEER
jgi:hypothetical protein